MSTTDSMRRDLAATARDRWTRWVLLVARILLLLWAGFWTWFVVAHIVMDGWDVLPQASLILVPLLCPVVLCFIWPRVGGVALICAGIAAWLYFGGGLTSTHCILALPAVLFGAVFLFLGSKRLIRILA